jgi:PAT family beta-lactamase induction signal transducer AmpG
LKTSPSVLRVFYVAWLSSIVNKQFAAVQYVLLSSLDPLVGTLTRNALGEMDRGIAGILT